MYTWRYQGWLAQRYRGCQHLPRSEGNLITTPLLRCRSWEILVAQRGGLQSVIKCLRWAKWIAKEVEMMGASKASAERVFSYSGGWCAAVASLQPSVLRSSPNLTFIRSKIPKEDVILIEDESEELDQTKRLETRCQALLWMHSAFDFYSPHGK